MIAREKNCGPVGTLVPTTWTSQVPAAGADIFITRRLFKLSFRSYTVPLGSVNERSRSFTKYGLTPGEAAGSGYASATCRSWAPLGSVKLHPRSSDVLNDSLCTKFVCTALYMFNRPLPSCMLGIASPAPLVGLPYCPTMSLVEAPKIALTKYEVGSAIPTFSIRCSNNKAVAPAAIGVAILVPPM